MTIYITEEFLNTLSGKTVTIYDNIENKLFIGVPSKIDSNRFLLNLMDGTQKEFYFRNEYYIIQSKLE